MKQLKEENIPYGTVTLQDDGEVWNVKLSKFNTDHGSVTYGIIKYSNDLVITTELDDHFADDKVISDFVV